MSRQRVVISFVIVLLAATAPAYGSTKNTYTLRAYDHARCYGSHWVLKSTTAKPDHARLRNAKLSDTNGDGIDDRADSWAVSASRPLFDPQGRRDGWVYRGSHFVTLWNYSTDTWGTPKKVRTYGLHFRMTCKRR